MPCRSVGGVEFALRRLLFFLCWRATKGVFSRRVLPLRRKERYHQERDQPPGFQAMILLCLFITSATSQNRDHNKLIIEVFEKDTTNPVNDEIGDECSCALFPSCPNGTVSPYGTGKLDLRMKGVCDDYIDKCCIALPANSTFQSKPKKQVGCGQRNTEVVGFRIIGDKRNQTQFGEFPWMIALLKRTVLADGTDLMYQGGGALIHESLVLTAAHCIKKEQQNASKLDLYVRAGEWDTKTRKESFPRQTRKVIQIIIHPGFQSRNVWNDFALLLLERPVVLDKNVGTVCLPTPGVIPQSKECWASGWGKDKFGRKGKYQNILKKIDLPIIPRNKCIDLLQKTRLTKYFRLHESFLCAGGVVGKDTCEGDGGSPLVCPIDGKPGTYEVSGLVSWGIGCGTETPGVYADVSYAREWIDKTMAELDLSIN